MIRMRKDHMSKVLFFIILLMLSCGTSKGNDSTSNDIDKVFINGKINIELATRIFRYTANAMKAFPYINEYQHFIDHWTSEHTFNLHQFQRFIIVSIFLDYRAARHQGKVFTTIPWKWHELEKRPITKMKLRIINYFRKEPIKNDDEYLLIFSIGDILDKKQFKRIERLYNGKCLYNFVINGILE